MTVERELEYRQAVEHSIADACRVPGRDPDPMVNARAVWESAYSDLSESVLDEYHGREAIVPGRYTPPERG